MPGSFVHDFFNDPLFLHRLQFFHRDERCEPLAIVRSRQDCLTERLESMRRELRTLKGDSSHLLRAVLYEVLVSLNRWYAESHGTEGDTQANPTVYRFLGMLEEQYQEEHRVSFYARRLGVTPGHLSFLTRGTLGLSAKQLIDRRLLGEARRRLLYSDRSVFEVGQQLGFEDPSYFGRFFKRGTGKSPNAFRKR